MFKAWLMDEDRPLTSRELLEDPKIPPIAKAIFALLESHPDGLTKNQISFFLGLCDRTVERNLLKLPWVSVHSKYCAGGRGRHNLYYITTQQRLQRDPSNDWSGVARSVDPVRMADMRGPTAEDVAEAARVMLQQESDPTKTSTLESDTRVEASKTSTLESDAEVGHQSRTLMSVFSDDPLSDPALDFTDSFVAEMIEATKESPEEKKIKSPPPKKRSKTDELIRRNSGNPLSFRCFESPHPAGSPDLFPFLLPKEEGMETSNEVILNLLREENKYNNIKYSARDLTEEGYEYGEQTGPRWVHNAIEAWMHPAGRDASVGSGFAWKAVIDALLGDPTPGEGSRDDQRGGPGNDQRLHPAGEHTRSSGPTTRLTIHQSNNYDRGATDWDQYPGVGHDPNTVPDVGVSSSVPRSGRGGSNGDQHGASSRSVRSTSVSTTNIRDRLGGDAPAGGGNEQEGARPSSHRRRDLESCAPTHPGFVRRTQSRSGQASAPKCLEDRSESHEEDGHRSNLHLGPDRGEIAGHSKSDHREGLHCAPSHPKDNATGSAREKEDRKAERPVATRRVSERQKRINKAKEIALKKAEGKKLQGRVDPALLMAYAFEEALADYHYRPTMKFIKNRQLDPKKKSTQFFAQAARLATAAGADFGDFVRAQFYWFHIWFGRDCRTHELRSKKGSFSAIERYRQYMKLLKEGKIPRKVTATSIGLVDTTDQEVDKINNTRLDRLCELWNLDPRNAIIAFAPEGIFDQDWLDRNPTYLQLRTEGRL